MPHEMTPLVLDDSSYVKDLEQQTRDERKQTMGARQGAVGV